MSNDKHPNVRIHPTASVADDAVIGEGSAIWQQVQIRERARLGKHCVLGKCVFVGVDLVIGDNCKIENHASLHEGATLEDGVFIGPHVVLTNDKVPRAINPDGSLKAASDWVMGHIHIGRGASIGSGSVILPDVRIGPWALVGAGSVVTRDVPAHGLVLGNPAHLVGYVCKCGQRLQHNDDDTWTCPVCGERLTLAP